MQGNVWWQTLERRPAGRIGPTLPDRIVRKRQIEQLGRTLHEVIELAPQFDLGSLERRLRWTAHDDFHRRSAPESNDARARAVLPGIRDRKHGRRPACDLGTCNGAVPRTRSDFEASELVGLDDAARGRAIDDLHFPCSERIDPRWRRAGRACGCPRRWGTRTRGRALLRYGSAAILRCSPAHLEVPDIDLERPARLDLELHASTRVGQRRIVVRVLESETMRDPSSS
jgi:hypothetical protein